MTYEETKNIISGIIIAYPNYKLADMKSTLNLWYEMLKDYPYNVVSMSLKAYICKGNEFAPSIGQLITEICKLTTPQELNSMEAWGLVSKALRNGYYGSAEEFKKLPVLVQKALGTHEQLRNWACDENFNEEVAKSHFIKAYNIECQRKEDITKLPKDVQMFVENINSNSLKAQIESKNISTINSMIEENKAINDKHSHSYDDYIEMPEKVRQIVETKFLKVDHDKGTESSC